MTDAIAVQRMYERTPITAFSVGTALQLQMLRETAAEIRALTCSAAKGSEPSDGIALSKAQGLFWLWTLGAYEVIRAMAQAKECFTPEFYNRIVQEKKNLARVRMPFAKQERAGQRTPVWRELFSLGYEADGSIIFEIDGQRILTRDLIERFETFMDGIRLSDVVQNHQQSYR